MATLSVQSTSLAGLDPTFAAADAAGDDFPNTGNEYFHIKNGSASQMTVTFDATTNCNQGFDHDASVAVAAGGESRIGPFPSGRFGDSVAASYSDATSVTVAAVKV